MVTEQKQKGANMSLRKLKQHEKALVASIEDKWKPLSSGRFDVEGGVPVCRLCLLPGNGCEPCPLPKFLGAHCHELGYFRWDNATPTRNSFNKPRAVAAAKVMLGNLRKCLRKVRAAIKKAEKKT